MDSDIENNDSIEENSIETDENEEEIYQNGKENGEINGEIQIEDSQTFGSLQIFQKGGIFDKDKKPRKVKDVSEGKMAFEVMKKLVKKSRKRKNGFQLKYPSCLADMINQGSYRKFPCTLCGKLFPRPDELITHANAHTPEENPLAECCFCGMGLLDFTRLQLHQMSVPIQNQCYTCHESFPDFNEWNHHTCKKIKSRRVQTNFICKLGCNRERHFPSAEALELHLFSLHGASSNDDPSSDNAMKFCIMCRGFVNAYRLSLEDHTYFKCNGRHPWIKENIRALYNLAKDQSLNLAMIIKLELECQFEEWKARDAVRGQSTGLIKVPPWTNKDIVMKCLPKEDKKYNCNVIPFLLPPNLSFQTRAALLNAETDALKIFHMWNNIVTLNFNAKGTDEKTSRDFEEKASTMFRNINNRLPQLNDEKKRYKAPKVKEGKFYSDLDWENPPSDEVLKRLQTQLGDFAKEDAVMNPLDHDRELLSLNKFSVREISGEDIDPTDFLQIEQKK